MTDSRAKILTPAAALDTLRGRTVVAVCSTFDILRAAPLRDLGRLRAEWPHAVLLAVVTPADPQVLSPSDRARMAAAVAMLDCVVTIEAEPPDRFLALLQPACSVRWEAADADRTRQLIEHVRRQSK